MHANGVIRLRGDAATVDVTVTASLSSVVADGAERHRRITRGAR